MSCAKLEKPLYINATGRSGPPDLASAPPFVFNNVTTRAFPIKANLAKLTQFCDDYLNLDQNIVQFRPSLPFVYLMVLNYGSMSSASVQAQNVGWVSQHEVTFTVALERWCWNGRQWAFKNWACVSPFIFVDDELSQTTGREVYGWPKIVGVVEKNVPLWAADPRSPTQVFSLQIPVFPKLFAGAREELRDFIQIDRDPVPRFTEFPLDPGNPWNPLSILPAAAKSWLGLMGISADILLRSPARGYRDRWNWRTLRGMAAAYGRNASRVLPDLSGFLPIRLNRLDEAARRTGCHDAAEARNVIRRPEFETITLKQFRDAEKPEHASYQAIISSPMGIDRVNRFGLLGDYNMLRGDVRGGYTIRIHRYPAQPIVETLGLEVAAVEEGDDAPIAVLKPSIPFWTDVDLHYGLGDVLCSRAKCYLHDDCSTPWKREGTSDAACPEPHPEPGRITCHHDDPSPDAGPGKILYNTVQGGATQPVAGPFHFPDVTLQVYPLLASQQRLQTFLDEYLNQPLHNEGSKPAGIRIEAFGSYAYLLVSVQGGKIGVMWSETNNIGWWADKELSFAVPVKCYRRSATGDSWELISLGMVSPFIFGNSGRAVITDREVNGRPSVKANIDSPADVWLAPSGPEERRHLLRLETEVFPALHLGQKAEPRTLVEIDGRDVITRPYRDDEVHRLTIKAHWGEKLALEQERKKTLGAALKEPIDNAAALARELLLFDAPFNGLHLKQYRDAAKPDRACYQALVKTTRQITRLYELKEIAGPIHVRLHKYPGFPITAVLGLKVKHVDSRDGTVVDILEPVRPFWMRVGLKEHLAQVLCWRTEQGPWAASSAWVPDCPEKRQASTQPFFVAGGHTAATHAGERTPLLPPENKAKEEREALRKLLQPEWNEWVERDPVRVRAVLTKLGEAGAGCDLSDAVLEAMGDKPANELYPLVEALYREPGGSASTPSSKRLTRTAAQQTVEKLPEVQLVVEALLD